MLEFVRQMFAWGCPIDAYVLYGTITPAQYKEITGKNYPAVTQQ
ncbi:XkdX family protein [Schleiferilactobacillus perolens]